jgi:GNAT superfamily N-acetyltransferase
MISIRPAVVTDIETLCSMDLVAQTDTERKELIAESVKAKTCYVAVSNGEVIGYGVLTYSFYRQGWIDLVYVTEGYRRLGAGRALLDYMERQCHTAKLFTSTNLSNFQMQALLGKLGYTVSGVINNLDDADLEIVYFKRLS